MDRIGSEAGTEPVVTVSIEMTPEQYVLIKRNASWLHQSVQEYLLDNALNNRRTGC